MISILISIGILSIILFWNKYSRNTEWNTGWHTERPKCKIHFHCWSEYDGIIETCSICKIRRRAIYLYKEKENASNKALDS